jgi:hypothetical protein
MGGPSAGCTWANDGAAKNRQGATSNERTMAGNFKRSNGPVVRCMTFLFINFADAIRA